MTQTAEQLVHHYKPRGAARTLLECRDEEILIAGPAGTGKSRAALEKMHLLALINPGFRGLMLRKTLQSLTATGQVTYAEKVAPEAIENGTVKYFGGSGREPAAWKYSNGSVIVIGGMDNPTKIMSSEYDAIYVQEATELLEDEWEKCTTRLRNGIVSFQQLMADCNPDAPTHWLRQRCDKGLTTELLSRHEDNPVYFEDDGAITPAGRDYIGKLDRLTGARYLRLRKGLWVAAEGLVYEDYDPNVHVINWFKPPDNWPRFWGIDFGYIHPFVCYDDQTEIRTDQGWRLFADLDGTELVAAPNMETHAIEWQAPTDYIAQDYDGPMLVVESGRAGANFCVTPNHRMVLENRKKGGWSFHDADAMPTGNYSIPVGWEPITYEFGDVAFARFLGLWLADGCLTYGSYGKKQRSIRIAQKNRVDAVREVVGALGVRWTERVDTNGVIDFRINDNAFIDRVFGLCGKVRSADKRVPKEVLTWGQSSLRALLDGLLLGDGSPRKRDPVTGRVVSSQRFLTTSVGLADDVQMIAALLGMPTDRTQRTSSNNYSGRPLTLHAVSFSVSKRAALTRMDIRKVDYQGKVHCVTVPNGALVVRRAGRPMVSGNCQMWATDGDGRMYLYREIFHTKKTVDVHARDILSAVADLPKGVELRDARPSQWVWREPKPRWVVADHDAENRAVLERELGMGTQPAAKGLTEGIQVVQARMKIQGDGKPRIFLMRDAVVEVDPELRDANKPACSIEEMTSYVWHEPNGTTITKRKEVPVKAMDDGMDCLRYVANELDQGRPRIRSMNG